MAFGLSATTIASLGSAALGAYSASQGGKQSGTATTTNQNKLDPRIESMLFGQNGQTGLLDRYRSMLDTPQNGGVASFGRMQDGYLAGQSATDDFNRLRGNAFAQLDNKFVAPNMQAAQINAPAQNGVSLKKSFESLINGAPGANPYLTGAIQKGINQSNNAFQSMQQDATKNLLQDVLPSIRSNSVLTGQYGGSRQGIAEGRALGDFSTAQQRAIGQFGQNNTDAAVAAQAGAYDTDRNRQLAATMGLSNQQYGAASQDAAFRQNSDQTNIHALMGTNTLNAGVQQNGISNLSGLLGNAYNVAQNQDGYELNKAARVNGLLAPYTSANNSSTSSQPLYQNQMGNMLGGAMLGKSLFGGGTVPDGAFKGEKAGSVFDLFSGSFGV